MIKTRKKELGQFFTPARIARIAVSMVSKQQSDKFLAADPGYGEGALSLALIEKFPNVRIEGYEIDGNLVQRHKINDNIKIHHEDYLFKFNNNNYDLVICNPPYNRFQNYENINQIKNLENKLNIHINKLSSSYVLFIYKAIHELKQDGEAIFIVPIEFFNTKYGIDLKRQLHRERTLHSVVLFDTNSSHFDEAITTTCILKITKSANNFIRVCKDRDELIEITKLVNYSEITPEQKWFHIFTQEESFEFKNTAPLYKYAKVTRGIATGANHYFILTPSQVKDLKLPHASVKECIVRSSDVISPILDVQSFDLLKNSDRQVYIFTGSEIDDSATKKYIDYGLQLGVHLTFLNSRRTPWYKLEKSTVYPILLSVFDRSTIKAIYNKASVLNLTTFHGLHVNPLYHKYTKIIYLFFITNIANQMFKASKRIYGNGLLKLEPNDYNNTFLLDFEMIGTKDYNKLGHLFYELEVDNSFSSSIIKESELIFLQYLT